jgi:hypothetical protein
MKLLNIAKQNLNKGTSGYRNFPPKVNRVIQSSKLLSGTRAGIVNTTEFAVSTTMDITRAVLVLVKAPVALLGGKKAQQKFVSSVMGPHKMYQISPLLDSSSKVVANTAKIFGDIASGTFNSFVNLFIKGK